MEVYIAKSHGRRMILVQNLILSKSQIKKEGLAVWANFSKSPKYYWKAFKWEKQTVSSKDEIEAINDAIACYLEEQKPCPNDCGHTISKCQCPPTEFYTEYFRSYSTSGTWGDYTATSENSSEEEASEYLKSLGLDNPEVNGWYKLKNGYFERESDEDRGFYHRIAL